MALLIRCLLGSAHPPVLTFGFKNTLGGALKIMVVVSIFGGCASGILGLEFGMCDTVSCCAVFGVNPTGIGVNPEELEPKDVEGAALR